MATMLADPPLDATVLDAPDMEVDARELFGVDVDMKIPAFSAADERVPDLDPGYVFDPYYATRAVSAGGPVLGALVYFRGQVEHSAQTDPYTVGLVNASKWIKTSGQWSNTGQIVRTFARVYPSLHVGAPVDKHGRDTLYRSHVEGRALGIPLAEARAFLETC